VRRRRQYFIVRDHVLQGGKVKKGAKKGRQKEKDKEYKNKIRKDR